VPWRKQRRLVRTHLARWANYFGDPKNDARVVYKYCCSLRFPMATIRKESRRVVRVLARALVVVAICSLAVNVATRYCSSSPDVSIVKAVKCNAPEAKRQHLLANGAHWTAPTPTFTFLPPPRTTLHVVSADVLPTHLFSESWLYNRPPPTAAFLILG
jgi:hypothetical protein